MKRRCVLLVYYFCFFKRGISVTVPGEIQMPYSKGYVKSLNEGLFIEMWEGIRKSARKIS